MNNELRTTNIEDPAFFGRNEQQTTGIASKYLRAYYLCAYYLPAYKAALQLSRELYKSPLFMQNKPKVKIGKMNITSYITTVYENKTNWTLGKSGKNKKAKQSQSQNRQNEHNILYNNELRTINYEQCQQKQSQTNPNKPNLSASGGYKIEAQRRSLRLSSANQVRNNQISKTAIQKKQDFLYFFQIFLDFIAECTNIYKYGKKTAFNILSFLRPANADGGNGLHCLRGQN